MNEWLDENEWEAEYIEAIEAERKARQEALLEAILRECGVKND